ncbi:MAG: hypothetical protein NTZ33_10795 [Bacteroidetes bacterium]|nr:hypothetical protein [Bacteroidota bacterium]
MKCCGNERGKAHRGWKIVFIPMAVAAGIFVFGTIVMYLWNNVLHAVTGVGIVSFWQALGILILAKILFGGFNGMHKHHKCHSEMHDMHHKWMKLSPEEREKLKAEWESREC